MGQTLSHQTSKIASTSATNKHRPEDANSRYNRCTAHLPNFAACGEFPTSSSFVNHKVIRQSFVTTQIICAKGSNGLPNLARHIHLSGSRFDFLKRKLLSSKRRSLRRFNVVNRNKLAQEKQALEKERVSIRKSLRDRPDLPKLFHGSYDFRRENVVELSQLISRHLEDKPSEIDCNKIYNCVRSCVTDLEKDWSDNPAHYYMDMRIFLATCLASRWFTDDQVGNIEE